jgi:hypothetical protein
MELQVLLQELQLLGWLPLVPRLAEPQQFRLQRLLQHRV